MKHSKKRTWSRQQRLRYKLAIHKRRAEKAIAEGARKKLLKHGVVIGPKNPTSLTHTPTRLIPSFKPQVPSINAIFYRFKELGPNARRFILAELMRFEATQQGVSEVG